VKQAVNQETEQAAGRRGAEAPADSSCGRPRGWWRAKDRAATTTLTFADLKQRQLVFQLTRQLAEAQFVRADQDRTRRLWQEVAALELDPERIIHLLYGVADHADSAEMAAVDGSWRPSPPPRRGRLMGRERGGGHRSAPPTALSGCR
jgi:hypothetical protein